MIRSLLLSILLASVAVAQTLPVTYADLTPSKQAELVEAWKKNYRSEISALPPGQLPLPVCKPVAAAKPVGPDTYESAFLRVVAGETVMLAVGVASPDGYTGVTAADAKRWGVPTGLWKCWKDGGGKKVMVAVGIAKPSAPYSARWTHPADLRSHLMGQMHGFSAETLKNMSLSDMERLHDEDHDRRKGAGAAPTRKPILQYAPLPNFQSFLRPGAFGTPGGSYCPPGVGRT